MNLPRRLFFRRVFCSSAALSLNLLPAGLSGAAQPHPRAVNSSERRSEPRDTAIHHILLVGDFGSHDASQRAVANAMQRYVLNNGLRPDWLVLLGDNFYSDFGALKNLSRERWVTGFEHMYPAHTFPGPCPAVLGNHDYLDWLDGPASQLNFARESKSRWYMPSKWYRKDLGSCATFLFLDTNLASIDGAGSAGFFRSSDPRSHLTQEEEAAQWLWLQEQLSSARGTFTCVVGHHPVFSNGMHGDQRELVTSLAPLLQKHGVHFYFAAHDHDLQHLEIDSMPTSFVISGSGGAQQRPFGRETRPARFFQSILGFSHLSLSPDRCTLRHIDVQGNVLHSMEKHPDTSWNPGAA